MCVWGGKLVVTGCVAVGGEGVVVVALGVYVVVLGVCVGVVVVGRER